VTAITVRSIRLRDLPRLRGIRCEMETLDPPLGRVERWVADPLAALPVVRRSHKTLVAFDHTRPISVLDLRADPSNHRWIVARMSSSRPGTDADAHTMEMARQELLVHAVRAAGAARAKRIHAAVRESSPTMTALTEVGFAKYATDSVMVARRLPTGAGKGLVRRQEASDVWSVHQLYHSVTPRPVQYAEALTSNYWDNTRPGVGPARGYVIDNGFEIAAHCRVASSAGRHVMSIMVHPGALDLIDTLVPDVISDTVRNRSDEVIMTVPGYLQEYQSRLSELGFDEVATQVRLVKYTVVPRRMQLRAVEELARELPERVAAGTPTYFVAETQRGGERARRSQPESKLDANGAR
jgi:hypothetical protein